MTIIALKKLARQCFEGDVAMPKIMFWMAGTICLLAGMVIGLTSAPMTHGVRIGCNNGNNNGNTGGACAAEKHVKADRKEKQEKGAAV